MSERQQLLYEIHDYLGRPCPTIGEQLMDRLAFALMALVALIDRRVWSKQRGWFRTYRAGAWRTNPNLTPELLYPGLPWFDWQMRHGVPLEEYWQPDGWRPARYV